MFLTTMLVWALSTMGSFSAANEAVKTYGKRSKQGACGTRSWYKSEGLPYLVIDQDKLWLGYEGDGFIHQQQLIGYLTEDGQLQRTCGGKIKWEDESGTRKVLLTSDSGWIHFIATSNPNIFRPVKVGPSMP